MDATSATHTRMLSRQAVAWDYIHAMEPVVSMAQGGI